MRLWFARNSGALFALVLFVAMFAIYIVKNGVGLKVGLVTAVANKGVLLALVAMAQTMPILTSGLDLSVGMIFVSDQLHRFDRAQRPALDGGRWIIAVLLTGVVCGAINGALVVYGRLQPIIATLATGAIYYGLALTIRPVPGGSVEPVGCGADDADFRRDPDDARDPAGRRARRVGAVSAVDDGPRLLRGRLVGIGCVHDRHRGPAIATRRLHAWRPPGRHRRPAPHRDDAFG